MILGIPIWAFLLIAATALIGTALAYSSLDLNGRKRRSNDTSSGSGSWFGSWLGSDDANTGTASPYDGSGTGGSAWDVLDRSNDSAETESIEEAEEDLERAERAAQEAEHEIENLEEGLKGIREDIEELNFGETVQKIREEKNLNSDMDEALRNLRNAANNEKDFFEELKRILKEEEVALNGVEHAIQQEEEVMAEVEEIATKYKSYREKSTELVKEAEEVFAQKEQLEKKDVQNTDKWYDLLVESYRLHQKINFVNKRLLELEENLENLKSNLNVEGEIEDTEAELEVIEDEFRHIEDFSEYPNLKNNLDSEAAKAKGLKKLLEEEKEEFRELEGEKNAEGLIKKAWKGLSTAWGRIGGYVPELFSDMDEIVERNREVMRRLKEINERAAFVLGQEKDERYILNQSQ